MGDGTSFCLVVIDVADAKLRPAASYLLPPQSLSNSNQIFQSQTASQEPNLSPDLSKMSHFIDVAPAYAHDAPPAYVAYEADDAATLVGTEPRASADDCSGVDDYSGGNGDAPRVPYGCSEVHAAAIVSDTLRSDNGGERYGLDIRSSGRYSAADDFDVRGLYDAADAFDIRAGDRVYAPADASARDRGRSASPTASAPPSAPGGRFARVRRVLRSVGRRLRRFLPK
ncbi:hypothetical protein B0H15DRAFT_798651 [Mycena belliarum]|uniref:Uncharacterized protein n=1 Tax=Mycena belliarum TaxID=1033014 RepID=A0AAD6UEH9_9AGAR|nr:hypothetical protein B0H15DRAFT_798651 [Mycena belliae]